MSSDTQTIEPGKGLRVCFVCLGNICRSPTAEGVFRHLVTAAGVESWPSQSKDEVARTLIARIADALSGRGR